MATRLGFCIVPFVVIVFIVSLGFLFKWSRDMVRQEAIERADCMLTNTTLRAAGFLNEIQTTTNNTVWQINANLNPDSLTLLPHCKLEACLAGSKAYDSFQFVRQGYFCCDAKDSSEDHLVFNRTVSLKSSYKPKR